MTEEQIILVDENDNEVGLMGKMDAHLQGRLHRAISVFIFNSKGELLLHQRADGKYHSGGLWTNTCCSHPRPGESALEAAHRRLKEEMGMQCHLQPAFRFLYKAVLDNHLTEHELDHVFVGTCDTAPVPDPTEVKDWKYMNEEQVSKELTVSPEKYTAWFKMIYPKLHSERITV